MGRWQHTSIALSVPFRELLAVAAPLPGDRSAGLRALALLGAAQLGLPLDAVRGELPGLLASSLDHRLLDALLHLHHGEKASRAHGERIPIASGEHPSAPSDGVADGSPAATWNSGVSDVGLEV